MDGWKGEGNEEGPLFASFRCRVNDRHTSELTIKQQNENTHCVIFVFFTEDDKGMLNSSSSLSSEITSWKQEKS